jgi:hypothetical protein
MWAAYFSTECNIANYPELLNLVNFCFAIPARNGNLKVPCHQRRGILYLWFPYRCVISNSGVIHCPTQHIEC